MGTSAVALFIDNDFGDNETLCAVYSQSDGYPTGYGADLKKALAPFIIVEGIGDAPPKGKKFANGAGCLAAQVIKNLKTRVGGIYVVSPNVKPGNYEYTYIITAKSGLPIHLEVYADERVIYDGDVAGFNPKKAEEA